MFLQLVLQVGWVTVALIIGNLKLLIDPALCLIVCNLCVCVCVYVCVCVCVCYVCVCVRVCVNTSLLSLQAVFWSNLFKHHLELGHSEEAYCAMMDNPDPVR